MHIRPYGYQLSETTKFINNMYECPTSKFFSTIKKKVADNPFLELEKNSIIKADNNGDVPEIFIEKECNLLKAKINEDIYPVLIITIDKDILKKIYRTDKEIHELYDEYKWDAIIIKNAIKMRKNYLLVVATRLGEMLSNDDIRKPLLKKKVIQGEMHPSAFCSIIRNKYIKTPQGIFKLSSFLIHHEISFADERGRFTQRIEKLIQNDDSKREADLAESSSFKKFNLLCR